MADNNYHYTCNCEFPEIDIHIHEHCICAHRECKKNKNDLIDYIVDHGTDPCYRTYDTTYRNVSDYGDLLISNIDFFKGAMPRTWFYLAKWGEGTDQNNHAIVATETLITLHEEYRVFTVDGQSNYSDERIQQRSYLEFLCEMGTYEKVRDDLLADDRIWTYFLLPDMAEETNIIPYTTNLTIVNGDRQTNFRKDAELQSSARKCRQYQNIEAILKDLVYCFIVNKQYKAEPTAERILLEHIQQT